MRRFLAEFLGTLVFLAIAIATTIAVVTRMSVTDLEAILVIAFAHMVGAFLGILLASAIDNEAGHINPAITLLATITNRTNPVQALIMIIAQILASFVALIPGAIGGNLDWGRWYIRGAVELGSGRADRAMYGVPKTNPLLETWQAVGLEAAFTLLLALGVIYFSWRVTRSVPQEAFSVATVIFFAVLIIGTLSGSSINPARWIGPAVISSTVTWETFFVFAAAPIVGALIAWLVVMLAGDED